MKDLCNKLFVSLPISPIHVADFTMYSIKPICTWKYMSLLKALCSKSIFHQFAKYLKRGKFVPLACLGLQSFQLQEALPPDQGLFPWTLLGSLPQTCVTGSCYVLSPLLPPLKFDSGFATGFGTLINNNNNNVRLLNC